MMSNTFEVTMAKNLFDRPYKGRIEHPRGTFFDRTEEGVRLTKITGSGHVLFTTEYTTDEFGDIALAMSQEYVAPPVPEPEPEPELTPDPAPRATGGTPNTDPPKPSPHRAKASPATSG